MITSCQALVASTLSERVNLELFDSTQISNPAPSMPVRIVLAIWRVLRFVRRFESQRPQALMLFAGLSAGIIEKGAMARYARLRGVPAVIFPRAGAIVDSCRRSAFTRAWARFSFRAARKIACQSASWRSFAIETLGFAPEDVIVVRNWTANPDLLAIGERRGPSAALPVRLLFVGWLERSKGIIDLIRACGEMREKLDFTLQIVGDGDAADEARDLVARLQLAQVVEFRGWLQTAELHAALRSADVFVLPSWAEGLPNAMIEAMAARVAVLVSAVGAIPEVITDHKSGLLVPPRDGNALSHALEELIRDGALRQRLADEAFIIAKREFAPQSAVEQIMALINDITKPQADLGDAGRTHPSP
jgi:glycosyltransferase involved in cell wall biosynthesis